MRVLPLAVLMVVVGIVVGWMRRGPEVAAVAVGEGLVIGVVGGVVLAVEDDGPAGGKDGGGVVVEVGFEEEAAEDVRDGQVGAVGKV